jgi:hypothetical protein
MKHIKKFKLFEGYEHPSSLLTNDVKFIEITHRILINNISNFDSDLSNSEINRINIIVDGFLSKNNNLEIIWKAVVNSAHNSTIKNNYEFLLKDTYYLGTYLSIYKIVDDYYIVVFNIIKLNKQNYFLCDNTSGIKECLNNYKINI